MKSVSFAILAALYLFKQADAMYNPGGQRIKIENEDQKLTFPVPLDQTETKLKSFLYPLFLFYASSDSVFSNSGPQAESFARQLTHSAVVKRELDNAAASISTTADALSAYIRDDHQKRLNGDDLIGRGYKEWSTPYVYVFGNRAADGTLDGFCHIKFLNRIIFQTKFDRGRIVDAGLISYPHGHSILGQFRPEDGLTTIVDAHFSFPNGLMYVGNVYKGDVVNENGEGSMKIFLPLTQEKFYMNTLQLPKVFANDHGTAGHDIEISWDDKTGMQTIRYPQGVSFSCPYVDGKRHGLGTWDFHTEMKKIKMPYENDKPQGNFLLVDEVYKVTVEGHLQSVNSEVSIVLKEDSTLPSYAQGRRQFTVNKFFPYLALPGQGQVRRDIKRAASLLPAYDPSRGNNQFSFATQNAFIPSE